MIPLIDYGGIAIIIPMVTAIGSTEEEKGRFGFDVFMTGGSEPLRIHFATEEESEEAREELLETVARYHVLRDFGPEVELEGPDERDDTH